MDIDIDGIVVIFPFKPYDIQIEYMRSVIRALNNRQNALLESPTGTGKTLSLLCSSLAWLEHRKSMELDKIKDGSGSQKSIIFPEDLIITENDDDSSNNKKKNGKKSTWKQDNRLRIIYSSRTHSQLNQAVNELKNSYYNYCNCVTIGSRDQLCINPDVMKLESITAKNQHCRYKVKNNLCTYHHNYERKCSDLSFCGSKIYDIEDLIAFGNEHKACPYYMSKALTDYNTDLTFMPYNYILDPSIRKTLKLNLENTIIIFDEGHNIERVCEDSMSTEIKSNTLVVFIQSFDHILKSLKDLNDGTYNNDISNSKELADLNIHDVAKIKLIICNFEEELDRLVKKIAPKGKTRKGSHDTVEIFNILYRCNLNHENIELLFSLCQKIETIYMGNTQKSFMSNQTMAAFASVCSFLEILQPFIFVKDGETLSARKLEFIRNYKLYTETDEPDYTKTWLTSITPDGWTVYLWCMSPSVAIQSLKRAGVYNLIITSGTLAPLESFELEMGIPFNVKLQNSHVIKNNQLSIQLITRDPKGNELCGSYDKRDDRKYYSGLGLTIIELAKKIPKGMFIFFSSYTLINRCIEEWKGYSSFNIWTSISSVKKIFVEPRNKREFNSLLDSFKYACDQTPEGAIFMGVSRGKLSEGIDLGDDYCRAVMIISLPYPAKYDPKVILKEQYLNDNKCRLSGSQWYILQMKRALNQSIGRVIRHKNDYGMIILCDSRFKSLNDGFSKWILPFFNRSEQTINFTQKTRAIDNFFKRSNQSTNEENKNDNQKPIRLQSTRLPPIQCQQQKLNENDNEIETMFENMITSYTKIKDKQESIKKYGNIINKNAKQLSIFDLFNNDGGGDDDDDDVKNKSNQTMNKRKVSQQQKPMTSSSSINENDVGGGHNLKNSKKSRYFS